MSNKKHVNINTPVVNTPANADYSVPTYTTASSNNKAMLPTPLTYLYGYVKYDNKFGLYFELSDGNIYLIRTVDNSNHTNNIGQFKYLKALIDDYSPLIGIFSFCRRINIYLYDINTIGNTGELIIYVPNINLNISIVVILYIPQKN